MRKVLYRFLDRFAFVDVVLILMIAGLAFFTWTKYDEGLQTTKRLATQKLLIEEDIEVKSIHNWFQQREIDLTKIAKLYLKDSKKFTQSINQLYLDSAIVNIYVTDQENKVVYKKVEDSLSVNLGSLEDKKETLFLGIHSDGSLDYGVLTQPIYDAKGARVGRVSIKLNLIYIMQLFHTEHSFKSYLFDTNYFILSENKKMDAQVMLLLKTDIKEHIHIFEHLGIESKEVLGVVSLVDIYNYHLYVVNEVAKDVVFKENYKSRNKALYVLVGALFFVLYLLMFFYKRRRKEELEKREVETILHEKQVESIPLLWDKEAFHLQYVDMEDMEDMIISLFKDDTPQQLEYLQKAIEKKSYKDIKHYAHTIKGAASNLSALEVMKKAQKIEDLALKEADIEKIETLYKEFKKCCFDTIEEMKSFSTSQKQQKDVVELSYNDKQEQLQKIEKSLRDSVYIESATFTLFEMNEESIVALKYAIDSFDTEKALSLVEEMLEKEEK